MSGNLAPGRFGESFPLPLEVGGEPRLGLFLMTFGPRHGPVFRATAAFGSIVELPSARTRPLGFWLQSPAPLEGLCPPALLVEIGEIIRLAPRPSLVTSSRSSSKSTLPAYSAASSR